MAPHVDLSKAVEVEDVMWCAALDEREAATAAAAAAAATTTTGSFRDGPAREASATVSTSVSSTSSSSCITAPADDFSSHVDKCGFDNDDGVGSGTMASVRVNTHTITASIPAAPVASTHTFLLYLRTCAAGGSTALLRDVKVATGAAGRIVRPLFIFYFILLFLSDHY